MPTDQRQPGVEQEDARTLPFAAVPAGRTAPSVWRQLFFPINDNYYSLLATTTLFAKLLIISTLVLTGAEDKALQGCNLSADSGAKPQPG